MTWLKYFLVSCCAACSVGWIDPTSSPYNCVLDDSNAAQNNLSCLQDAFDDGPVRLPVGTLWVDGSLDVSHSVSGFGHQSILKAHSPADFERLLVVDSREGLFLRDFALDGNGDSAASGEHAANLFIADSSHITVERIYSHNAQGDGVHVYSGTQTLSSYIVVRNSRFDNRGRAAIALTGYGGSNIAFVDNVALAGVQPTSTDVGQGACIDVEPSVNSTGTTTLRVTGNDCEGDVQIGHQSASLWERVDISDNLIADGRVSLVQVATFKVSGNVITGTRSGSAWGITLQDTGSLADVGEGSITGNIISDIGGTDGTGDGIVFTAGSAGETAGGVSIAGNVLHRVNGSGINVAVETENLAIIGNVIDEPDDYGMALTNTRQYVVAGNLLRNAGRYIGVNATALSGYVAGSGLFVGNLIGADDTVNHSGIKLSAAEGGAIESVVAAVNDLADVHSSGYALVAAGVVDYTYGRQNVVVRDDVPADEDF